VKDLSVWYDDIQILNGLSLSVAARQIVALVGANGAGKTTTLSAISGLVRKCAGAIMFEGENLMGLSATEIVRRGVIHVPEGRRLFPFMTVEENLAMGAYPAHARQRRAKQLDFVYGLLPRLSERRGQLANTLSGGEQQMCAIGRGLMSCPRLLMLDEPTLGLSPILSGEVFSLLKSIAAEEIPILVVEQQVVNTLQISDRAYVLENGACILAGSGRELLADDRLRRAYLGV
jgi:branched-chain amino acid transport system ATP-binding protein